MMRKPYVQRFSRYSWMFTHTRYMRYTAREVTCIFIGAYTAVIIVGLLRLAQGRAAWEAYMGALESPLSIVFHLVLLAFTVYHSVTWFNVTPKAMPLYVGEEKVPAPVIIGAHYAAWAVASAAILIVAGV